MSINRTRAPARLYVGSTSGHVSEAIVEDMDAKIQAVRATRKDAYFSIIDGQDTARLFRAYGKA